MSRRLEQMRKFSEQKKAELEAKNKSQEIKATAMKPTAKKKKRLF